MRGILRANLKNEEGRSAWREVGGAVFLVVLVDVVDVVVVVVVVVVAAWSLSLCRRRRRHGAYIIIHMKTLPYSRGSAASRNLRPIESLLSLYQHHHLLLVLGVYLSRTHFRTGCSDVGPRPGLIRAIRPWGCVVGRRSLSWTRPNMTPLYPYILLIVSLCNLSHTVL